MAGNERGVDLRDIQFVLMEQFGLDGLRKIERFQDLDEDDVRMILDEADRISREIAAPTNASVDHCGGVKLVDGQARVPKELQHVYDTFAEGGWIGLSLSEESGGQAMPNFVRKGADECFVATNPSFHTYPGLTTASARVIESFGTDWQKETFLQNMVEGKWTGTMCLTEPGAGSDIGDIRTTARVNPDGSYRIQGTKQFISGGDQDLTENIVHLVLARAEGAPKGAIGISLFIVPKFKVNPDGTLGARNGVNTASIEKKMGLKGSATAQLQFGEDGDCQGFILGGEGEGLILMFQMMHEARIDVGHQAMSMGGMAYEHALAYAKERIQGAPTERMGDANAPRVAIINHPDVRRMLMEIRSYVYATRRLVGYAAYLVDHAWNLPRGKEARHYKTLFELIIPVTKAYSTDRGLDMTNLAMLVYGGYGYIQEYPVEQLLRDVKVTSVYEGTNGIQSIDLLLRNVLARRGKSVTLYLEEVDRTLGPYKENPRLKPLLDAHQAAREEILAVTEPLRGKRRTDVKHLLLISVPYMEMFGHFVAAHMLLWGAGVADEKLQAIFEAKGAEDEESKKALVAADSEARYYHGMIQTARFFVNYILPKVYGLARIIRNADRSPLEMEF